MKSTRNNKYWLSIYFGLILSLTVLITLTILYFTGVLLPNGNIIIPIVLFLYAIFIFFYFKKLLRTYKIELTNDEIKLIRKNEVKKIKWNEILNVDDYGRNGFLGMETIKIKLRNHRNPILLYHSHYSNSNTLTQAVRFCHNLSKSGINVDLKSFTPINIKPIKKYEAKYEKINFITRIPLTTFRSYYPLLSIFFFLKLLTLENITISVLTIFVFITIIFLAVGIIGIGKAGTSDKYLVVQNYYFPIEKIYR
ncbi:hypothetical protein [uncultured Draconibacterium sp.]